MEFVAKVGRCTIETNGSGEVFLSTGNGKTKLRVTDVRGDFQITFLGKGGEFVPFSVNGLPTIVFVGKGD